MVKLKSQWYFLMGCAVVVVAAWGWMFGHMIYEDHRPVNVGDTIEFTGMQYVKPLGQDNMCFTDKGGAVSVVDAQNNYVLCVVSANSISTGFPTYCPVGTQFVVTADEFRSMRRDGKRAKERMAEEKARQEAEKMFKK